MKTILILVFIFMHIPMLSSAGDIQGTIKTENGTPLAEQVVLITQNSKVIAKGETSTKGCFSFTIKEIGNFKLEVIGYAGASFNVYSSNKQTHYNLSLKKVGDKWTLISTEVLYFYP